MKPFLRRPRPSGFTLLELSIAVVIILLLSLTVFFVAYKVTGSEMAKSEKENVMYTVECVRTTFGEKLASLDNDTVNLGGCFLEGNNGGRTFAGAPINSRWKAPLTVYRNANGVMAIRYTDVPKRSCFDFLRALVVTGVVEDITVNGQILDDFTPPMKVAPMIDACNQPAPLTIYINFR